MKLLLRCGGILFAITLIMGALLGFVNHITAPVIENLAEQTRLDSIKSVLEGEIIGSETVHTPKGPTSAVDIVEFPTDKGSAYAITVAPKGYGGEIKMMVGVNVDCEVTGISIMEMSETPGLGAKAKEGKFLKQFVGENPKIKAITGATITSNAIKKGVGDAITQVKLIKGGSIQ